MYIYVYIIYATLSLTTDLTFMLKEIFLLGLHEFPVLGIGTHSGTAPLELGQQLQQLSLGCHHLPLHSLLVPGLLLRLVWRTGDWISVAAFSAFV